jgi:hypothetical protein
MAALEARMVFQIERFTLGKKDGATGRQDGRPDGKRAARGSKKIGREAKKAVGIRRNPSGW